MTDERKYDEDEVRRIFGLAADRTIAEPPTVARATGLTLADIQEIGLEVGLEPAAIARAAAAIDVRGTVSRRRRSLGMPVEVGRVVPLPRAMTDGEWEQLVAELRATFRASGRVSRQGNLREWVNGNLHACVEPTDTGYRLRLGTRKGDAAPLNALGAVGVLAGAATFGGELIAGDPIAGPLLLGASGIGAFLYNLLRLPRWAAEREQQMEHIAAKVGAIMQTAPRGDHE